jgi:hypothetical protein
LVAWTGACNRVVSGPRPSACLGLVPQAKAAKRSPQHLRCGDDEVFELVQGGGAGFDRAGTRHS